MNNMEKYYTPTIEEFCVGFEFEIINLASNNYGKDKSNCEWNSKTLEKTDFYSSYKEDSAFETVLSYFNDGYVRVKYLDREDIESLGFSYSNTTYSYTYDSDIDVFTNEILNISLGINYYNRTVSIITSDPSKNVIFCKKSVDPNKIESLKIKNRTELRKLLNKLNIETTSNRTSD